MNIKGKLRISKEFTGRSVGHSERIQKNVQEHVDKLHADALEERMKSIDLRVKQGIISSDIGKILKKSL
tara:strand:- start:331 stop:537 length:207 start_codon:yes stop_codon:yes gene_type:complete